MFKTSLEPSLLVVLLETFLTTLSQNPSSGDRVREYMDALVNVPRFSTVVLLLTKREKDSVRQIWDALGVDVINPIWRL